MAKKEKHRNKFTDKYRLIVYNDNTFEEVGFIRLSRLNLIALFFVSGIIIVGIVYSLVAYTPLREMIPGYPDGSIKRNIIINALKVDSLEYQLEVRDQYIHNINALISGREPVNYDEQAATDIKQSELTFSRSIDDSLLREQIEQEEKYNLVLNDEQPIKKTFSSLHFFTPVTGIVTNSFNPGENHFGTDIVAGPNEVVKATLSGTVILATWTVETGYVIQIQHEDDIVSVYKHNSQLLKNMGTKVSAGESIAIIGNSGELTTGPHLHFELWHNGNPVNAEEYMVF